MKPVFFDTSEELDQAVADLEALGTDAIRMLAELTEHQSVERANASPTARALERAGFAHIRDPDAPGMKTRISSRLWGEEALEALLDKRRAAAARKAPRGRQAR